MNVYIVPSGIADFFTEDAAYEVTMPDSDVPDGRDSESTFSRVMNSPVAQNDNRVAVLLVFERGFPQERVMDELDKLSHADAATIRTYSPSLAGHPSITFETI